VEFSTSESVAVAARSTEARAAVSERSNWSQRRTLTKIDRRLPLGKRITELTKLFTEAVGGEITPLRRMRIAEAAELKAWAEKARGDHFRNGTPAIEDVVPLERAAAAAFKAIGIVEPKRLPGRPSRQTVPEYLAGRGQG
jgi:hypothetical protein